MKASPNFSAQLTQRPHIHVTVTYLSNVSSHYMHCTPWNHTLCVPLPPIRASTLHLLFRRIFEKASLDGLHEEKILCWDSP